MCALLGVHPPDPCQCATDTDPAEMEMETEMQSLTIMEMSYNSHLASDLVDKDKQIGDRCGIL